MVFYFATHKMAPVKKHNKNGKNKEANQPSCQILLFEQNCYFIKYPDFDDKLPALFDPDGTNIVSARRAVDCG
jgi:hypothetical protein